MRLLHAVVSVPVAACLACVIASCTPNPGIGGIDRYVATTPDTFCETRVFYLGDPERVVVKVQPDQPPSSSHQASSTGNAGTQAPGTPSDPSRTYNPDVRRLMTSFQVAAEEDSISRPPSMRSSGVAGNVAVVQPVALGSGKVLEPSVPEDQAYRNVVRSAAKFVRHNDPLSIIVNKVVMPQYPGTRDIAVVLDILTKGDQHVQPLVVWYQRNAAGGKELTFENLLVYFDPAWDSKVPAHFRIRIIDVENEDNQATLELLNKVKGLASAFSGMVPHPVMPAVNLGIEAATQILGHQNNTVLMDYTVEFYAAAGRGEHGGADLGYLRTGQFIAVGLNRNQDAERWRQQTYFDMRTLRLYDKEDLGLLARTEAELTVAPKDPKDESGRIQTAMAWPQFVRPRVDAPIVLMTVTTSESVVPTIVQDRSEELTKLLSQPPSKMDLDAVESSMKLLTGTVKTFVAKRRVDRDQTSEGMKELIDLLRLHTTAIGPGASDDQRLNKLSDPDLRTIMLTLRRQTGMDDKSSVEDWTTWWESEGSSWGFQLDEVLGRRMWRPRTSAPEDKNTTTNSRSGSEPAIADGSAPRSGS